MYITTHMLFTLIFYSLLSYLLYNNYIIILHALFFRVETNIIKSKLIRKLNILSSVNADA